jgi:hypothetical protein
MRVDEKAIFEMVAASEGEALAAALDEIYEGHARAFHSNVEDLGPHFEFPKHTYRVTLRPDWRGYDGS